MPAKPKVLVFSPSNLRTDPRVNRQLRLLRDKTCLTAAGFADPQLEDVVFIPLAMRPRNRAGRVRRLSLLLLRRFERYYEELAFVRSARATLTGRSFDLIIANDAESWPVCLDLRGRGRVLLDAHEYTPREFEHVWWWRLFQQPYRMDLCRRCLPRGDGMLTVCPGIADEYFRQFNVRPTVIMNVPHLARLSPSPVEAGGVQMIHHGGANPARKIENMIRMMDLLDDRFTLDLMLVPEDSAYVRQLRRLAGSRPRVRFLPPVPMAEIAARINSYDLGIYLLEPNSFNNLHALPNKFFEFIQARLGVAIGPSPEMARVVREHACGVVAEQFRPEALARALQAVTPELVMSWKENAHRAAERLSWETESNSLLAEIARLLNQTSCAA